MTIGEDIIIGEDIQILRQNDRNDTMKAEPLRPSRGSDTPFYKGGKSRFIVFQDYDPTRELDPKVPSSLTTSLDNIDVNQKDVKALTDSIKESTDGLRSFLVQEIAALPLAIRQAWTEAQETIRFAVGVDDVEDEEGLRRFESYVEVCVRIKLMDKAMSMLGVPLSDRDTLMKTFVLKTLPTGGASRSTLEELRDLLTGIVRNPDPPYGDTNP